MGWAPLPHPAVPDADPFRVLALPYDAAPGDVRAAFRKRARQTHPDQGGSAGDFHAVRVAYEALDRDLDGERARWNAPSPPPASRVSGGLSPAVYPTCPVRISRSRDGKRRVVPETERRPARWRPGAVPPPRGTCVESVAAKNGAPPFGVWRVPTGPHTVRYVFGPSAGTP